MTSEDCGHHHDERRRLFRRIFYFLVGLLGLAGFVVFLVWAVLRPSKPHFVLQNVNVRTFDFFSSPANLLNVAMEITVAARNPNDRIGIYYQKMDIHASYRGQQVTAFTLLPTSYQGHNEITVWSPNLYGTGVPVAPELGLALSEDENAGALLFNIRIDGEIKWKVGTWISWKYRLNVNCPAFIRFRNPNSPTRVVVSEEKFQFFHGCNVEI